MSYNGWENYETWLVGLWLNNDEWTQERALEIARDGQATWDTADALKLFVTEEVLDTSILNGSLAGDLLGAAIGEVSWDELAQAFMEDVQELDGDEDYEGQEDDPAEEYTFVRDARL